MLAPVESVITRLRLNWRVDEWDECYPPAAAITAAAAATAPSVGALRTGGPAGESSISREDTAARESTPVGESTRRDFSDSTAAALSALRGLPRADCPPSLPSSDSADPGAALLPVNFFATTYHPFHFGHKVATS